MSSKPGEKCADCAGRAWMWHEPHCKMAAKEREIGKAEMSLAYVKRGPQLF